MDITHLQRADFLDIVFDNRNKEYGAYQLRRSYGKRITKALLLTGVVASAIISLAFLPKQSASTARTNIPDSVILISERIIPPNEVPPIQAPVQRPAAATPVRTEVFATIKIVNTPVDAAIATPDDLDKAQIGLIQSDGPNFTNSPSLPVGPPNNGIIAPPAPPDDVPMRDVDQHAKFQGDWVKFLRKNLRSEVPVNNEAPAGRYTVLVEFVVDAEGNVSDVTAITQHGYGLEQEAIRVIKKSDRWIPSFWKGRPVKAYHKQQITFEVISE